MVECVVGARDKSVRVWDVASGECVRTLSGHTDRCDFGGMECRWSSV